MRKTPLKAKAKPKIKAKAKVKATDLVSAHIQFLLSNKLERLKNKIIHSPHEAYGFLSEEFFELLIEVQKHHGRSPNYERIIIELVDVAAYALRAADQLSKLSRQFQNGNNET